MTATLTLPDGDHEALAEAMGQVVERADWQRIGVAFKLTPQELQATRLTVLDLPQKSMARLLRCKLPTVKTYIQRACAKAGVRDRVGLVDRVWLTWLEPYLPDLRKIRARKERKRKK